MSRSGWVSDTVAASWLSYLQNQAQYAGLALQDPYGVADPRSTEPQTTGYVRQPLSMTVQGRVLVSTVSLAWLGLTSSTLPVAVTLWSDLHGNSLQATIYTLVPVTPDGGGLTIPAGQLFTGLDI